MSDAKKPPTISALITVYNKAPFLPDTIRSLRRQTEDETSLEYVFVDDASSDGSVRIVQELTADAPHVRVIENADNRGPSIRLNQAAAAATGDYLYCLDGDDIATQGAMIGMLGRLRQEQADVIYGKAVKRPPAGIDLLDLRADSGARHHIVDHPLAAVIGGGFVRMALMCRRTLFLDAGGANERIFVQDESLALRLAAKATKMIAWEADVIAMPPVSGEASKLSRNPNQLHHDAFLAYRLALSDFGADHPQLRPALYARAVSAYWKYARRQPGLNLLKPGLWRYLETRLGHARARLDVLAWMEAEFAELDGIRRM